MTDNSPKGIVARFWELYNDPATIGQTASLCSEDCCHEQSTASGTVQFVGRKAQLERIELVVSAFNTWHVTPLETLSDGSDVASRYLWTGTLKVPFAGYVAGTKLAMRASCFFGVANGLIVRVSDVGGPILRHEEGHE